LSPAILISSSVLSCFLPTVNVNGEETHPVYAFFKHKSGVIKIDWNFAKFTVDKNEAVKYYRPTVMSKELSAALQSMLSGIHQVD
jgi:glutathione peroxidase-family protein